MPFTLTLEDQTLEISSPLRLTCKTTCPSTEVQWCRNGQPLSSGSAYNMTSDGETHSLEKSEVTEEDDADFSCVIMNREAESTAHITVIGEAIEV